MSADRYRVVVERPAEEALSIMGPEQAAAVLAALEVLRADPHIDLGGVNWKKSRDFRTLKKRGVDVRIFNTLEIQELRVFYYIDEAMRLVLVKEITRRRTNLLTYGTDQPHVRRLVENYSRWLQRRVQ